MSLIKQSNDKYIYSVLFLELQMSEFLLGLINLFSHQDNRKCTKLQF